MKTSADFQKTGNPAVELDPSAGRFGNARKHFQQSRLSRTVAADYANHLARHDFEAEFFQRPDGFNAPSFAQAFYWRAYRARNGLTQCRVRALAFANAVLLA